MPQYYIKITPEKERELFEFIIKECNGVILGPSDSSLNDDRYSFEYFCNNEIKSPGYLISDKNLHENQFISNDFVEFEGIEESDYMVVDGLKFCLSDGELYRAPYIEYGREEEAARVYVNYIGIRKNAKELLKPLFESIRKWVKKNAVEIEKMDILKIYHIR